MTQLLRVRWSDDRADLAGSARNLQERSAACQSRILGKQDTGPSAGQPEPASSSGDNAQPVSSSGDNAQPVSSSDNNAQPVSSSGDNAQPVLSSGENANLRPSPRKPGLRWFDKWQR